uniref:tumor necrosis factor receptor superfamily member 26 isoform X2 n=1 Tax=Scatophagus argus TaxID=75038 RepID=UPI001ED7E607|nr:tumor necrosis factor receptor superfamily member 26 isoform X2 [Scatophagus argus]
MAADSHNIAWILTFLLVSEAVSPSSAQCVDGTYEHDGKDCCRCAAGQRVVKHCTENLQYGECDLCEPGTYSSNPNNQMQCELCTSCAHPNDNLEEKEPCTPARDTKCQCKKDHFCVSNTGICKLCHPCDKCVENGIKVGCTNISDTVCNDKAEEGNHGRVIGGIIGGIIGVIVLVVVVFGVFRWRKGNKKRADENQNGTDVEGRLLRDIGPHLSDIADVIGWKPMRDIAMRDKISDATIDSCKLNYPGDSQEQTLQLLKIWVESQGMNAGKNLIQRLETSGKRSKAEEVMHILDCDS